MSASKEWETKMQDHLKHYGKKLWRLALSPRTIAIVNVAGLLLKVIHEIEERSNYHTGRKAGFRLLGEDE